MVELLTVAVFIWLMVKAVGLAFRLTWGFAKIAASILMGIAMPLLFICLVFVGGISLLAPIVLISIAVGILKSCG